MPNRVIKESIKRSPQIDALTWFEEVVFYRLIVTADDYGCIDGRPVLIKNELFPTRENVTRKSVEDAITKLVAVGLLYQYEVDGKPYLAFPTWEKHQRIRNKHRKYPAPPDSIHLSANCCQTPASCQPESESESESNPNPNPNPDNAQGAPELEKCGFSPALRAAVEDWLAYKRERREAYKPTGLKALLTQISSAASAHGDAAVIGVIRQSMSSGYKGITFDRLGQSPIATNESTAAEARRALERMRRHAT